MAREYKYDAFISYRHVMPDMKVAERLQNLLEAFRKKDYINGDNERQGTVVCLG